MNLAYVVCDVYWQTPCTSTFIFYYVQYLYIWTRISYNNSSKYYVQMCEKLQLLGDFVPQNLYRGFAPGPHWETSVPKPPDWPVFILYLSGRNSPSPPQKIFRNPPKIWRTNSWLDDTDKNFGPDLPSLFKLHEIWSFDSQENHSNRCHRCQILRLNCTKFDFSCGSTRVPAGGAYSTSRDSLLPTGGRRGEEEGGGFPPFWNPKYSTAPDCTQFWPHVTWCTNTLCVVAVQVKQLISCGCCKLYFSENFFFLFSSLHLYSDGNNITQVETVDSFVAFLTLHMELWRIYIYPCLQLTPGQPCYKVCSWPWPWRPAVGPWSWLLQSVSADKV